MIRQKMLESMFVRCFIQEVAPPCTGELLLEPKWRINSCSVRRCATVSVTRCTPLFPA
ncbi:hypothetical protein COOONC_17759 [Cooperia oncophora]